METRIIVDERHIEKGIEEGWIMKTDSPLSKEFYGKIFVLRDHSNGSKINGRVFLKEETYGAIIVSKQSKEGKISRKHVFPKKGGSFQFENTNSCKVETIDVKLAYFDKERTIIYLKAMGDVIYEMDFKQAYIESNVKLKDTSKFPIIKKRKVSTVDKVVSPPEIISQQERVITENDAPPPQGPPAPPAPLDTFQNETEQCGEDQKEKYSTGADEKLAYEDALNTEALIPAAGTSYLVKWAGENEAEQFEVSKHADHVILQISGEDSNLTVRDNEKKVLYWPDSFTHKHIRFFFTEGKIEITSSGEFDITENKEYRPPYGSRIPSKASGDVARQGEAAHQETNWADIPEQMICNSKGEQKFKNYEHLEYWKKELKGASSSELRKILEIKPLAEGNKKYPPGGSLADIEKKLAYEVALGVKISAARYIIDKDKSLLVKEEVENILTMDNDADLNSMLSTFNNAELLRIIEGDVNELIEERHKQIEERLSELNSGENLLFLCGYTEQVISMKLANRDTAEEIERMKDLAKETYLQNVNNSTEEVLDEIDELPDARSIEGKLNNIESAQSKIRKIAPDRERLLTRIEGAFYTVREELVKKTNEIINDEIKRAEASIAQAGGFFDNFKDFNKDLSQITKEILDRNSITGRLPIYFSNYPEIVDVFRILEDKYTSFVAKKLRKDISGYSGLELCAAEQRDDYRQKSDGELMLILTDPMLPVKHTTHPISEWDKWSVIYGQQIKIAGQVLKERGSFNAEKVANETRERAERLEASKKAKEVAENERVGKLPLTVENLCRYPSKCFTSEDFFSKQLSEKERSAVCEFIALKIPYNSSEATETEDQDNLFIFKDKIKGLSREIDGYATISHILKTGGKIYFTKDKRQGVQHAHTIDSNVLLSQAKSGAFSYIKSLIIGKIRNERETTVNGLIEYFKEARYNK